MGRYDGTATSQPSSATSVEVFLYLGLPAVITIAQGVIIYILRIDKHMPQMQRDLAARRIAAVPAQDA